METNPAGGARRWRLLAPAIMAAAIVLVRLPSLSEPQWASDEGFFTAGGLLISKGVTLYAGVFDVNPPVVYWFFRLLVALGAVQHHVLTQLVAMAATVAASLLTYGIVARVSSRRTALLAGTLTGLTLSIPTLDGDLLNVELLALPLFLGALLLAFSRRPASLVAAGVLLALAYATRPSFVVDSLALAVPLLSGEDRVRRVLAVAVGGAAGLAAVVAGLWAGGSLGAYLTLVMPADHAYLAWSNEGTLLPLFLRLAFLAAVGVAVFWRTRTPAGRLATVWFFAAIAGSSLTPREITHYVHEAVPAIAFALALLASRVPWRALSYPLAAVAVVVVAELALYLPGAQTSMESGRPAKDLHPNFTWAALPAYYGNWFQYAVGGRDWARYSEAFPGAAPTDAAEARRLRALAGPGPLRIVVLGDRPWLLVDSGAFPATRYIATNSAFWQVKGAPTEMRERLRGGCIAVVVVEGGSGDWGGDLAAGGYQRLAGAPWPTYLATRTSGCP